MKKEIVLSKVENCIINCDLQGLSENVEVLLKSVSLDEASKELVNLLNNNYTSFNADATAKMMEVILRIKPSMGMLEFPDNCFFRLALITGSFDLYEGYKEEVVDPFLSKKRRKGYLNVSLI